MTTESRTFGEIITFYSYKGGTGRSMAMANVAHILATKFSENRKPVLMIDWDLEAPGLHQFFFNDFKNEFGSPRKNHYAQAVKHAPGLIDFFTDVEDYYTTHHPSEKLPESLAQSEKAATLFRQAIEKYPLEKYQLEIDGTSSLFLLKAGGENPQPTDGPGYQEKVRRFDWDRFYIRYGSFFTHFREYLMMNYSYVLIDSRTGLTDTSGICTRVMPEKLVAVFIPNHQNIGGIKRVVQKAVEYRMNSRDPRHLLVFPLASRIDTSASKYRTIWLRGGYLDDEKIVGYQTTFEDLFKQIYDLEECDLGEYFDATYIPHDSDYAYGEKIAARIDTMDKASIGRACTSVTNYLTAVSAPWEKLTGQPEPQSIEEVTQAKVEIAKTKKKAFMVSAVGVLVGLLGIFAGLWAFLKPDAPQIISLTAAPHIITAGEPVKLCYDVRGAVAIQISPPIGELGVEKSKCLDLKPEKTTTYTLTATSRNDQAVSKRITIKVQQPPEAYPPQSDK